MTGGGGEIGGQGPFRKVEGDRARTVCLVQGVSVFEECEAEYEYTRSDRKGGSDGNDDQEVTKRTTRGAQLC